MGERITWEDAVKQDVWQTDEHGGLVRALRRMEDQYGIDAGYFVKVIGGASLEHPEIGPRIMEWWNDFFQNLQENKSTKVTVSAHIAEGHTQEPREPIEAVGLDDLKFLVSDDIRAWRTDLVVEKEGVPSVSIASSDRRNKRLHTLTYIDAKTGKEKRYSSYRDYHFEEAEEQFWAAAEQARVEK